jgi:O-succinylbenzoate synthase
VTASDIFIARYELRPRSPLNARATQASRSGALLRLGDGFADLHPWPELGDEPLERQMQLLAAGTPTTMGQRSLACAVADGVARSQGISLFDGLEIPESHRTITDLEQADWAEIRRAGFAIAKIKLRAGDGPHLDEAVRSGLKLRIDLNATGDAASIERLLEAVPLSRIDFLEDPMPYDDVEWTRIRTRFGIRIAADREKKGSAYDVVVIKPAIEELAMADRPLVFTSSMDHPIGQMWAAWNAARARLEHGTIVETCGLLTHLLYEPDPFIERVANIGPRLVPPGGTGLGFDDLLEAIPWRRLR